MKLSNWLKADGAAAGSNSFVLPLELEDARPVKIQRTILRTGSIILLAATLWAGVTPIRELAIAPDRLFRVAISAPSSILRAELSLKSM